MIWDKAVEEYSCDLTKEDKNIIKNFGKLIGKTNIEGQINYLEMFKISIENQLEKARKIREKNEGLCKKLGVILGVMIAIILI